VENALCERGREKDEKSEMKPTTKTGDRRSTDFLHRRNDVVYPKAKIAEGRGRVEAGGHGKQPTTTKPTTKPANHASKV